MTAAFIHPQALVEGATLGEGTRVWAFAHVQADVVVGRGCNIGDHCFLESGVRVGDDVVVKNGVSLWTGVTLQDRVFVGPNAVFTNDIVPRAKLYHQQPETTVVEEGASVGANATLLSGIRIGRYAVLGAGTVVTRSVPAYAVVVGNPGRVVGYRCACTRALPGPGGREEYACECGRRFRIHEAGIEEAA